MNFPEAKFVEKMEKHCLPKRTIRVHDSEAAFRVNEINFYRPSACPSEKLPFYLSFFLTTIRKILAIRPPSLFNLLFYLYGHSFSHHHR